MTVIPRGRKWAVRIYNGGNAQDSGSYEWLGTFETRRKAEAVNRNATKHGYRRCVGCGAKFRVKNGRQIRCKRKCGASSHVPTEAVDHWVYRCYDADGALLYVGLTSTGMRRLRTHARTKPWWTEIAEIKLDHFATREEAERREADLIRRLRPRENDRHNPPLEKVVALADYRKASSA